MAIQSPPNIPPQTIRNLCVQSRLASDGRYDVHLFHPVSERWVTVSVDDRLPVATDGRFKYTGMTSHCELWPCLYEKVSAL